MIIVCSQKYDVVLLSLQVLLNQFMIIVHTVVYCGSCGFLTATDNISLKKKLDLLTAVLRCIVISAFAGLHSRGAGSKF
jgi:hypothetical protein